MNDFIKQTTILFLLGIASLNLFSQTLEKWSPLSDEGVFPIDPHVLVLNDHVFVSQLDTTDEVFIYKLDMEGNIIATLEEDAVGGYDFYDEMTVDTVTNTIWMLGYAYERDTFGQIKAGFVQIDENLNVLEYFVIDTLGEILGDFYAAFAYDVASAIVEDTFYLKYALVNVINFDQAYVNMKVQKNGELLYVDAGGYPSPYRSFEYKNDRLFAQYWGAFFELNKQTFDPIDTIFWVDPMFNYDDWIEINSYELRSYFRDFGANFIFANGIINAAQLDTQYQEIEIRDIDFNLIKRQPVHGIFNPFPGNLAETELRLALYNPLDINEEKDIFLFGFDWQNQENWIVSKLDSNLSNIWTVNLDLERPTWANHLVATPDGGCILSGTYLLGTGYYRHVLYKLDANGNMSTFADFNVKVRTEIEVYPNPTTEVLFMKYPAHIAAKELLIINELGQVVVRQTAGKGQANVKIPHLPTGIYFAQLLSTDNQVLSNKKFLKK